MRPVGYNTSRYTKQDGDDHFGGALKFFFVIVCVGGTLFGIPIGLAMALTHVGLELWKGALIFFCIEGCCLVSCMLAGAYQMLETQVNGGVYDLEAGITPPPGAGAKVAPASPGLFAALNPSTLAFPSKEHCPLLKLLLVCPGGARRNPERFCGRVADEAAETPEGAPPHLAISALSETRQNDAFATVRTHRDEALAWPLTPPPSFPGSRVTLSSRRELLRLVGEGLLRGVLKAPGDCMAAKARE